MVPADNSGGSGGRPVSSPRPTPSARQAALTDLIGGVLESRRDTAGARFDAELDALQAQGEVSAEAARLLRYWQRASVRAVVEHARLVLPPTLAALAEADEEAERTVEDDSQSWSRTLAESAADSAETGGPPMPRPTRTAGNPAGSRSPTSLEEHRRRLLIAGLTKDATVER